MSFRARLVLAAAYLLTAVVLVLEVPLALSVKRRAISEFEAGALGNAAVVASQISGDVHAEQRGTATQAKTAQTALATAAEARGHAIGARIVVVDATGHVITDTGGAARPGTEYATPLRPEFNAALVGRRIDVRQRYSTSVGDELLLVTVPVVDRGRVVGAVRISESLAAVDARVRETWLGLAVIGAIVVAAGLGLAWLMATSLARPVQDLEDAAIKLGRGDLDARAEVSGPKEIRTLGRSFNRMAARLSSSLTAQRDFTANASHQLRTPLTGLKLRLESIEHEGGRPAEEARKAGVEADRLAELVDDLLALAAASTRPSTAGSRVDLAESVRSAHDRWADAATRSGRTLRVVVPSSELLVEADPRDLADVLDNLIENAVKYSPEGSEVVAEAGASDGRCFVAVSDSGPGIAPEERDRVFERFFRGSLGRAAGAGTGLGLAIVEELTHRWGGEVRLGDGPGMRIEATFPQMTGA